MIAWTDEPSKSRAEHSIVKQCFNAIALGLLKAKAPQATAIPSYRYSGHGRLSSTSPDLFNLIARVDQCAFPLPGAGLTISHPPSLPRSVYFSRKRKLIINSLDISRKTPHPCQKSPINEAMQLACRDVPQARHRIGQPRQTGLKTPT